MKKKNQQWTISVHKTTIDYIITRILKEGYFRILHKLIESSSTKKNLHSVLNLEGHPNWKKGKSHRCSFAFENLAQFILGEILQRSAPSNPNAVHFRCWYAFGTKRRYITSILNIDMCRFSEQRRFWCKPSASFPRQQAKREKQQIQQWFFKIIFSVSCQPP